MEQSLALGIMLSGRNCFLTGAAGAGKTYVLNKFIADCKHKHRKVAITASTGIAATHLNGNTIHSWSGIGGYDRLPGNFFLKMAKSRRATIETTQILIIDEISMLHDWFFELLNQVCKTVRKNNQPFGGIQLIVSGDFFQLPPVSKAQKASFATHSLAWKEADFAVLYLASQYRQEDAQYLEILNRLRDGDYRRGHIEKLMSRIGVNLDTELTQLHTHNYAVDHINLRHLSTIPGSEEIYEYTHTGSAAYYEKLAKNILAPETLRLKPGALVMAVKNVPEKGFMNGSTGTIIDFAEGWPVVKFRNGHTTTVLPATWELIDGETRRASVTQIPLRLAWAITVHKSQGMTLDAAKIDLSRAFEKGMGYVALSRVKSLTALSLVGINQMAIKVSEEARAIDADFQSSSALLAKTHADLISLGKAVLERKPEEPKTTTKTIKITDPDPEAEARKQKWAQRVEKEREKWPNARKPWTLDDSHALINAFLKGTPVEKLSHDFGRKPRSIMMRLNDTFDTEIFSEDELWGRA